MVVLQSRKVMIVSDGYAMSLPGVKYRDIYSGLLVSIPIISDIHSLDHRRSAPTSSGTI